MNEKPNVCQPSAVAKPTKIYAGTEKKVYCKNCVFFDKYSRSVCYKKVDIEEIDLKIAHPFIDTKPKKYKHIRYIDLSENNNGDCQYYKKLWYKIWV